ncbi:HNH endonuclease signature motif containing protein [Microvirga sp. VF16]|uniref:HNH endonuclease signature motif containing protein n=1 Tax=Microvirga sp. VF16 TaxID=2807101 RepID=UPI00193D0712|nr:HNH endonuclease signature motif containing protein [Microvirga sp. VF16]QRM28259.1 HNH endonuclease [Microvirga sp. VF16]
MPLVAPNDVGTTRRRKLTPRQRLAIWERARGICVLCEQPIDGVRERWIIEHIRALELGGLDEPDNMGPAHETCGLRKTQDDHRRAAKAKKQKIQHLGAAQSKRPMPCGRQSRWKKRLDGTIVPRQ